MALVVATDAHQLSFIVGITLGLWMVGLAIYHIVLQIKWWIDAPIDRMEERLALWTTRTCWNLRRRAKL